MKQWVSKLGIILITIIFLVPMPIFAQAQGDNEYENDESMQYEVRGIQKTILDIRVKEIAKEVEGLSQYDQIKYVYDYIILNCEYNRKYDGAYNALVRGWACCNGYASAFYEIMEELNIPCKYTTGEDHAWNTVYLDGYWYNIDATWGDEGGDKISYEYFLKSNKEWTGAGPAIADAPKSYSAQKLNYRYDYPDFAKREKTYLMAGVAAILVVIILLRSLVGFCGHVSTRSRIDRNEELIRNMYRLPEDQ